MAEIEGDQLPADLNLDEYVGVTTFPDPGRRRFVGIGWILAGVIAFAVTASSGTDGVLVNNGLVGFAIGCVLIGVYHVVSGTSLKIRETDALVIASKEVGFPIGHASAQLGFQGLLAKPTWRILLYSADNPPTKRGMVLINGRTGDVLGNYVEDNPEDPEIWNNAG